MYMMLMCFTAVRLFLPLQLRAGEKKGSESIMKDSNKLRGVPFHHVHLPLALSRILVRLLGTMYPLKINPRFHREGLVRRKMAS